MNRNEINELCEMIAERNHEVALEEATKRIATLESENKRLKERNDRERKSDLFCAGFIGAAIVIAIFAIAIFTYGRFWTTY